MKIIRKALLIAASIMLLTSCTQQSSQSQINTSTEFLSNTEKNTADYDLDNLIVNGSNNSGYELLKLIEKDKQNENLLISPISLSCALGMLQNGAAGDTKEGILNAMSIQDTNINTAYNKLLNLFSQVTQNKDLNTTLNMANSFWFKDSITPEADFVNTIKEYYNADCYNVDFSKQATVDTMNDWVDEKTNHLIKDVYSKFDGSTTACLVNTLYFKGTWLKDFNEDDTKPKPFFTTPAQSKDVDTMTTTDYFAYTETDDFKLVGLNYYDGTMYIILPKDDIDSMLKSVDYSAIEKAIADSKSTNLTVELPKFKFDNSNELNDYLKKQGMSIAFDSSKADFSPMMKIPGENVFVDKIFQNTAISVDEKGTEAAAVTSIIMTTTAAHVPTEPLLIQFNKPFMFIINDDSSNSNLFIGIVNNPS